MRAISSQKLVGGSQGKKRFATIATNISVAAKGFSARLRYALCALQQRLCWESILR
jgi:hypothetical protein